MTAFRVLLFGTYDASKNPRAEILSQGLEDCGASVSRCVRPMRLSAERRVSALRGPQQIPLVALSLVIAWASLLIASRRYRQPDVVLVGYLGHLDVLLARMRYPGSVIVLDYLVSLTDTARDRGTPGKVYGWSLGLLDRLALAASDIAVVDTDEHAARLSRSARPKCVVAPVGALKDCFATAPTGGSPKNQPLKVIFFGHFIPLQGTPTIGACLAELGRRGRRSDVHFTMVGIGQDYETARRLAGEQKSVNWMGRLIPREELNSLVSRHDVALGIFGTTPKAQRVVPTKVQEAAAAGLAVVTSDTAPQRRAFGEAALFIPPGDPTALADALESLADDRCVLAELRRLAHGIAREQWQPSIVVRRLADRLGLGNSIPG